jgi:hypothetical protein
VFLHESPNDHLTFGALVEGGGGRARHARAEYQAADLDVDDVERARRFCGRRRCGAGPRVIPLAVFS